MIRESMREDTVGGAGAQAHLANGDHRSGFALPMAMIALTVLGVLATTAFITVRQETQIALADENEALAFYIAEQGVTEVLDNWDPLTYGGLAQWASLTVADTLAQGIWTVTVTRGADRVYYLSSSGTVTDGGALYSGAARELGVFARVSTAVLDPPAALTTRGNASVKGNAEVHGEDSHPPTWGGFCGGLQDKPGILIDNDLDVGTVGIGVITGNPAVLEDPSINDSTFTQFGDLDWDELVALATITIGPGSLNNTAPSLDGSGDCNENNDYNWGDPDDPTAPCGNYFPIIHITGNANVQSGGVGQGILLVDGDLDLRGDFAFYGIVIVQGNFETQGSGNRVYGGVLAGNADFENQSLVGGSVVSNSTCAVERTIFNNTSLQRARPLDEKGWVDLSGVS